MFHNDDDAAPSPEHGDGLDPLSYDAAKVVIDEIRKVLLDPDLAKTDAAHVLSKLLPDGDIAELARRASLAGVAAMLNGPEKGDQTIIFATVSRSITALRKIDKLTPAHLAGSISSQMFGLLLIGMGVEYVHAGAIATMIGSTAAMIAEATMSAH